MYSIQNSIGNVHARSLSADALHVGIEAKADNVATSTTLSTGVFPRNEDSFVANILVKAAVDANTTVITLRCYDESGGILFSENILSTTLLSGDHAVGNYSVIAKAGAYVISGAQEKIVSSVPDGASMLYAEGSYTFNPAAEGDGIYFSLTCSVLDEANSTIVATVS